MEKRKIIFLTILLILCTGFAAYAVVQKMMSVQVKKGAVRSRPSFLGKIIERLQYGDRVQVKGEKRKCLRIGLQSGTGEGWMHASALSKKKIILTAGAEDVSRAASSDEIALAGKGFNKQVEGEFRVKNPNLDFSWIDRMETYVVSQAQMQTFIKAGGLSPEGGS